MHKGIKWGAITLAIVLVLVVGLSAVGPRLAVYVLSKEYAELGDQHRLNVERASLSLLRGQLDIEGVHATHGGTSSQINRASLAWSWSALFKRTARIAHINIDGIELAVRVAPGESANDAPRVDVFGLTLGENKPTTEPNDEAKDETKSESPNKPDEGGALAWALTSLALTDIALTLDIQPSPDAAPIHTQLHLAKATLADVFPGTENAPAWLKLRINELSVGEQLRIKTPLDITWQGQLALEDMDALPWSVGGDVALNNVQLALPNKLGVSLDTFSLNGFILDEKHIAWESVVLDTALLTGLSQQLPQEAPPLSSVGFERFELADASIDVAQQTLAAQNATLTGLSVLANEQPFASLESYTIEQLTLSASAIDTGMHRFANAQLHLEKQANGELWAASAKQTTDANAPQVSVKANEQANNTHAHEQPLSIRIKGVEQTNNSTINWRDNSLKPAPDLALNVTELSLSEVNSTNLSQPVTVSIKTKLDEFNQMNANANLALQESGVEGAFSINIEQLNLVPLSPYVHQAIGYSADQGLLHLTVDSNINQNTLKGTGHLHLASAQFTAQDKNVIERVQRNMTLPLNTALSLLSDQQRSVKIEFPVEGPLDNPNVGINDLLQTITNKALVAASLFYLKQSFQPYGAMVAVGSYAGDYLLAVRLDPLPLQDEQMAAQDTPPILDSKQTTYMQKVVETLQKKSELQLTVCPMVSKRWVERQIKSDSSLVPDFWKKRTADWGLAVKKHLMAQDASLAKRIVVCKPQQGDSSQIEMGF